MSLTDLPDELLLHILYFLDIPELLSTSRTSHHLRLLTHDPLLHHLRLRASSTLLSHLLPLRPPLSTLQPPSSTIYYTKTHLAARRLHRSLVSIRLNRSLSQRPALSTLVSSNILPKECCRWGQGALVFARKRRVERENLRDGLRVWLERKAAGIRSRQKDGAAVGGVGILVWRFSRRVKVGEGRRGVEGVGEKPRKEKVMGLRRFWEGMSG